MTLCIENKKIDAKVVKNGHHFPMSPAMYVRNKPHCSSVCAGLWEYSFYF
jgi:hypothetical protein